MSEPAVPLPSAGRSGADVLAELAEAHSDDIDWKAGRAFSLVYHADDPDLAAVHEAVAETYLHENALNPFKYPSLLRMEREVVSMAADLFGGDPRAGSMSSGGTESIFLACHVARQVAQARGIDQPNIIVAATAHPAFTKASHYLGLDCVRLPVGADLRADPAATEAAIDASTIMVVGSAPCYPYGTIDPIQALAAIAGERDLLCHVDACLGGWLLPFWAELGEPVPAWDFGVEGVTSISADIHKYGYCFKGASVVLYRDRSLLEHQYFMFDDWPGGLYASATAAGTRPATPIAGAWATLNTLGRDGLLAKAEVVRDTTRRFQEGIAQIDGLEITGNPDMSVFEFTSATHDIAAIGDVMDERGWHLDRQGGLHVMVSPGHAHVVDDFIADLRHAVANHGEAKDPMAQYSAPSV